MNTSVQKDYKDICWEHFLKRKRGCEKRERMDPWGTGEKRGESMTEICCMTFSKN